VVHIHLQDLYEVGGQVFLWAFATALAGARLGLPPWEPPPVDAATQRAQEAVNAYRETGAFAEDTPAATFDDLRLYGTPSARSPEEGLLAFLAQGQPGDYVTLQAYLPPPWTSPSRGWIRPSSRGYIARRPRSGCS
jgi:transaldolase/glucose-6-phosphate isomerase